MTQRQLELGYSLEKKTLQENRLSIITIKEAEHILLNEEIATASIPFRPKGGDVFLFEADSFHKRNDHKADGHKWLNQGTTKLPRCGPRIAKTYYYIRTETGISKNFRKDTYTLVDGSNLRTLIHYVGDESISVPSAHGNSKKQTTLFFKTKPSVLQDLGKQVSI